MMLVWGHCTRKEAKNRRQNRLIAYGLFAAVALPLDVMVSGAMVSDVMASDAMTSADQVFVPVDRSTLMDPTKPSGFRHRATASSAKKEEKEYRLSSIVFGGGRTQAVINGRFYK
jgi:hypothetical protein